MEISQNDWYASFLIPTLKVNVEESRVSVADPDYAAFNEDNLRKIRFHINELSEATGLEPGAWAQRLYMEDFGEMVAAEAKAYLDTVRLAIREKSRLVSAGRDSLYNTIRNEMGEEAFMALRYRDYNENVANFVLNRLATNKIYDTGKRLVQKADPVFMKPGSKTGRAHFFAPFKQVGNLRIDTLLFNVMVIWFMSGVLFVTLYYNLLKRFIVFLESLKIPIWRKFGRELLQF